MWETSRSVCLTRRYFLTFIFILCTWVASLHICLCTTCIHCLRSPGSWVTDVESSHVSAKKVTPVFCKSSQWFYLLIYLPSPEHDIFSIYENLYSLHDHNHNISPRGGVWVLSSSPNIKYSVLNPGMINKVWMVTDQVSSCPTRLTEAQSQSRIYKAISLWLGM